MLFGEDGARLTPIKCHTLTIASLLVRCAVLQRWRDAAPPTHTQWLRDIMSGLHVKKIHYSVCTSHNEFQNVWGTSPEIQEVSNERRTSSPSFCLLSVCRFLSVIQLEKVYHFLNLPFKTFIYLFSLSFFLL